MENKESSLCLFLIQTPVSCQHRWEIFFSYTLWCSESNSIHPQLSVLSTLFWFHNSTQLWKLLLQVCMPQWWFSEHAGGFRLLTNTVLWDAWDMHRPWDVCSVHVTKNYLVCIGKHSFPDAHWAIHILWWMNPEPSKTWKLIPPEDSQILILTYFPIYNPRMQGNKTLTTTTNKNTTPIIRASNQTQIPITNHQPGLNSEHPLTEHPTSPHPCLLTIFSVWRKAQATRLFSSKLSARSSTMNTDFVC